MLKCTYIKSNVSIILLEMRLKLYACLGIYIKKGQYNLYKTILNKFDLNLIYFNFTGWLLPLSIC